MIEPKPVEIDAYINDVAYALCDNIIDFYSEGEGPEYDHISALSAVAALTGEMIFSAVHNVDEYKAKLYKELFVLSPVVNAILYEDTENPTVYDCVAAMALQAGAQDKDFPFMENVLQKSLLAMTMGQLIPDLPLAEADYPQRSPVDFCVFNRKQTEAFFRDAEISNPAEKIIICSIGIGCLIQAISEKGLYSIGQLIETAIPNG